MSKAPPVLIHQTILKATSNGNTIESTYLLYTPKIIKFVYNTNIPKATSSPIYQNAMSVSFSQLSNKMPSSESKASRLARAPKIKLVSRGTTQSNSNLNNSIHTNKRQRVPMKKTGLKLHTGSSNNKNATSNIKSQSLLPVFNCGWCAEFNQEQEEYGYFPSRINMRKIQSRIIHIEPSKIAQQRQPIIQKVKTHEQRKKIFAQLHPSKEALNRSLDNLQRSRSRRSIFSHYNAKSLSLSRDLLFLKRRKIFKLQSNNLLRKQHEEMIKEIQIPLCIIAAWKNQMKNCQKSVIADPILIQASSDEEYIEK